MKCMRYGDGILCVSAIDNLKSFEEVKSCETQIRRLTDADDNILGGNKIDLNRNRRAVDTEVAKSSMNNHMPYRNRPEKA